MLSADKDKSDFNGQTVSVGKNNTIISERHLSTPGRISGSYFNKMGSALDYITALRTSTTDLTSPNCKRYVYIMLPRVLQLHAKWRNSHTYEKLTGTSVHGLQLQN